MYLLCFTELIGHGAHFFSFSCLWKLLHCGSSPLHHIITTNITIWTWVRHVQSPSAIELGHVIHIRPLYNILIFSLLLLLLLFLLFLCCSREEDQFKISGSQKEAAKVVGGCANLLRRRWPSLELLFAIHVRHSACHSSLSPSKLWCSSLTFLRLQ